MPFWRSNCKPLPVPRPLRRDVAPFLAFSQPRGLPVRALRRSSPTLCFVLATGWLALPGCQRGDDDDEAVVSRIDERPLSLAGGVKPVRENERLQRLFLPQPDGNSSRPAPETRTLTTDREGLLRVPLTLAQNQCVSVLVAGFDAPFRLRLARTTDVNERRASLGWDPSSTTRDAPTDPYAAVLSSVCADVSDAYQLDIRSEKPQALTIVWQLEGEKPALTTLQTLARATLPGFRRAGPVQHYTLASLERASFPIFATADRCIAVAVQGDDDVRDIDARFVSLRGEELALDVSTDASAVAGPYCPWDDEVIRVEFRMYAGQGDFQWQLWDADAERGRVLETTRRASSDGALPARPARNPRRAGDDTAPIAP